MLIHFGMNKPSGIGLSIGGKDRGGEQVCFLDIFHLGLGENTLLTRDKNIYLKNMLFMVLKPFYGPKTRAWGIHSELMRAPYELLSVSGYSYSLKNPILHFTLLHLVPSLNQT